MTDQLCGPEMFEVVGEAVYLLEERPALVSESQAVPCAYCRRITAPDQQAAPPWSWPGRGEVCCCLSCGGYRRCPDHGLVDESEHPGWHVDDAGAECTLGVAP